jgi:hypothetical protein
MAETIEIPKGLKKGASGVVKEILAKHRVSVTSGGKTLVVKLPINFDPRPEVGDTIAFGSDWLLTGKALEAEEAKAATAAELLEKNKQAEAEGAKKE